MPSVRSALARHRWRAAVGQVLLARHRMRARKRGAAMATKHQALHSEQFERRLDPDARVLDLTASDFGTRQAGALPAFLQAGRARHIE